MSDPVRTLLDELAPDVHRTRLAEPSAVRRRGDQRTHRKIAGAAVVGAVVVIAVALLGTGQLRPLADDTAPPTASQTPTVSASASTSVAPTHATVTLLEPQDLPDSRDG